MTIEEIEYRLQAIAHNRFLAHRLALVDGVEPVYAKEVYRVITQALDEVMDKLNLKTLTVFQEGRYSAMKKWYAETKDRIEKTLLEPVGGLRDDLKELAKAEAEIMNDIMSFGGQAGESFKTIGITAARAEALVTVLPGGMPELNFWMRKLGDNIAYKCYQQVQQGAAQGETYRQITKRIRGIGVASKRDAISLARTQVNAISNATHDIVREANKDIIKGVEWSAVWDNRTCSQCMPLDGLKWYYEPKGSQRDIANLPPRPLHVRCRCQCIDIPISLTELLGVKTEKELDQVEGRYRPYSIRAKYKRGPNKGKVYRVDTGGAPIVQAGQFRGTAEQWIKNFPDVAKDILGPTRADLLLSGKIKFKDLQTVPGKLRSVKDLKKLAGVK